MRMPSVRRVMLLSVLGTAGLLMGCARRMEILSRTEITGTVNASEVQGRVVSTIYIDRGGQSTCEFTRLPMGFNPATFGTHT